jgi:hypothetical protein
MRAPIPPLAIPFSPDSSAMCFHGRCLGSIARGRQQCQSFASPSVRTDSGKQTMCVAVRPGDNSTSHRIGFLNLEIRPRRYCHAC